MSLVHEQHLFLQDVTRLLTLAWSHGFEVTGGELYRTKEQQEIYVKSGRSMTMASNHLRRLAIDLQFFKNGLWIQKKAELQELGDYWENLNPKNRWGGNWVSFADLPHFERNV